MSDEQLIHEIILGDTSAFKILMEKYQSQVFRTAMGFVHSKEDAEDITQDIFVKVYQSLTSFKGESELSTWLYRITVNISINFVNRNRKAVCSILEDILHKPSNENTARRVGGIRTRSTHPKSHRIAT